MLMRAVEEKLSPIERDIALDVDTVASVHMPDHLSETTTSRALNSDGEVRRGPDGESVDAHREGPLTPRSADLQAGDASLICQMAPSTRGTAHGVC